MQAVDTHAHLDFPEFEADLSQVLQDLAVKEIGVITIATDYDSLTKVEQLTKNTNVWGSAGLHPGEINATTLTELPKVLENWTKRLEDNPKLVALGEIGLDYFRHHPQGSASIQQAVLRQLLSFALERQLPVIIHCRQAYGDMLTILSDYPKLRGVIHCYNGTTEQAQAFLELGFHLSFTGMLTYPANEALRQTASAVPLERLLLETDAPFLSVQSKRGQRNDPSAILEIAALHAELKGQPIEEILANTTKNAVDLFGLR